jgi:hypothetical protein
MLSSGSRFAPRLAVSALLVIVLVVGNTRLMPASAAGGAFRAGYTGRFAVVPGCTASRCTIVIAAAGTATFLGASTQKAIVTGGLCTPSSSPMTLTSTTTPANTIQATLHGTVCLGGRGFKLTGTYTFTGGTGTFAHATGQGSVFGTATVGITGTFTDVMSGTISY